MNLTLFHDSRNSEYRLPQGARRTGETVTLRLRVRGGTPDRVYLRLWWANAEQRYEMTAPKGDGLFEYALTLPDEPGLMWYYFVIEHNGCAVFYGNASDCLGGEGMAYDHEPPSFQLTIYAGDYCPPEWMGNGIMYQIMVDRFYARERKAPLQGWLHERWDDIPVLPNEEDPTVEEPAADFFGGNLMGIEEKLPYLRDLGVTILYLNPIFRARSNHKYNTGNYEEIDPSFGTEEDFTRLCAKAREMGIRVMLDGVFSHTGCDSKYFNKYGSYGNGGAYQDPQSPYTKWYSFERWPEKYDCWWGFPTLPNVQEMEPSYVDYILTGENAIVPKWLKAGASGWRLDVADELPMDFLRILRKQVKSANPDACVLGEVWEDASNKEAYGEVRCYCLGDTLDSVMNYPLREGVINFLSGKLPAGALKRQLDALYENYPEPFARSLMNLLGSHDKARVINRLCGATPEECAKRDRRHVPLTAEQYALGRERYIRAWAFVCSMPGMPCIYYADEAGQQGEDDPFCRATYPWGHEDRDLIDEIRRINRERAANPVLRRGALQLIAQNDDTLLVRRTLPGYPAYEYMLTR